MATAFTTVKQTPFLIGVTGGTSCGKTEVCRAIVSQLDNGMDQGIVNGKVSILSQDCFYKSLSENEKLSVDKGEYNLDHPDAFDTELMVTTLKKIYDGKPVHVPRYDFSTCQRLEEMDLFNPTEVVLFEGILVLYYPEVRNLLSMKLFVDLDSDTRLCKRVERDTRERGRSLDYVLKQYTDLVKPAFEEFTLPSKKYADVIIPRGIENRVAIRLIVEHIRNILQGNVTRIKTSAVAEVSRRRRHSSLSETKSRPH